MGKIFNACEDQGLSDVHSASRQDDMAIRIFTPGYARFHDPLSSQTPDALDHIFERRIIKLRRRSRELSSTGNHAVTLNNRTPRMSLDFRRLSTPRLETIPDPKYPNPTHGKESSSRKGYGFYSPWNGICEFSSGISGHALKCKHTTSTEGSQPVTVSELRFNLPTSKNSATASPKLLKSPERSKNIKRSSYFSHTNGSHSQVTSINSQDPHQSEDVDYHFDLSLGQENAGGGFAGKQAKLGKLIIEPEGLKMLDLLVAANMAVWWKVYEKSA
ncbi:MAG: hypothetical protein LQ338_001805 [Usnochroma carphineum]|nr:MAG: hypothetical protein LQ338_001805 [Usnochroma carphineum]